MISAIRSIESFQPTSQFVMPIKCNKGERTPVGQVSLADLPALKEKMEKAAPDLQCLSTSQLRTLQAQWRQIRLQFYQALQAAQASNNDNDAQQVEQFPESPPAQDSQSNPEFEAVA